MTAIEPTAEQSRIIEYPLSPLRVAAGAGTGKTTTMALRLCHLVETGQVEPEQALGITFTNKAAEELASRLRAMLPVAADEGREVEVDTYHGFAHGLLREFGPVVGVDPATATLTPGLARQLMHQVLESPIIDGLDLTAPGRRVDELMMLSAQLGDHLRTPEDLLAIPEDDTTAAARSALARVLLRYRDLKAALGVVDFSDLIAAAHLLVTRHPEIADRVRSRYQVVLLDEYQDTNPAQRQMLQSLFGTGFPVTAVGDADQTIYEWRGASLQNFADFPHHFPDVTGRPAATLELTVNRRSGSRIIDLANRVRAEIGEPAGRGGLRALDRAGEGTVRAGWFRTSIDEARWVAAEVSRMHGDGTPYRSIGILFRHNRHIALIGDALAEQGVPVEVASLGGLLEVPEVADLHAWLRLLGRPDDSPALMRVLLGSRYRLGLGDLAPADRWAQEHRGADGTLGRFGSGLLEAIDRIEELPLVNPEAAVRLARFRAEYRGMLKSAQGASVAELCRTVLSRTSAWLEIEALDDAARLSARLNLHRFLDLAEQWSPLQGRPTLEAFLVYLEALAGDGSGDELEAARLGGEDAVALLTVHRAKGLEWPVVFLPALCEGTMPAAVRSYPDPFLRPQVLPHPLRRDPDRLPTLPGGERSRRDLLRSQHDDQEWRAAYVAVTRAAEQLVATGAFWYTERRARRPGPLLEIVMATPGVEVVARTSEPGDPPRSLRPGSDAVDAPDPVFEDGWREALRQAAADPAHAAAVAASMGLADAFGAERERLERVLDELPLPPAPADSGAPLHATVSALVTFATCPLRFHWSEVERLPRRPSPALRRGLEVHRRIEMHHRGEQAVRSDAGPTGKAPTPSGGTGAFASFLKSRFSTLAPILTEAPFRLRLGPATVSGRIDAVYEPEPGSWAVVDFKTGPHGGDPAREVQLQAYALAAMEAGFPGGPPDRLTVAFVHLGETMEERSQTVDAPWLAAARERLLDLAHRSAGGERRPTPSADCFSCDFSAFCEAGRAHIGTAANASPARRHR